eukprot:Hpha_TRINITY_DN16574_c0_g8::TRINITY_DN16574_c0_g8_i1::g.136461::m.136461
MYPDEVRNPFEPPNVVNVFFTRGQCILGDVERAGLVRINSFHQSLMIGGVPLVNKGGGRLRQSGLAPHAAHLTKPPITSGNQSTTSGSTPHHTPGSMLYLAGYTKKYRN